MASYQKQKQQVLQLFQSAISLAKQYKYSEIEKHLDESAKHLVEGKLFVVVCGEFKQGKSSLINALLNEQNLFPVDVDITTNLVSSITYGKEEKVTVLIGEPGKEQAKPISRNDIPDYVTEQLNVGNVRQARMLILESPNSQLKDGLVLVDTPGVGGLNTDHTAIAYAFIPNADAILFVSDAQKPLMDKELDFVEMIARHCQNLIFAVTKKDVGNYQQIVESNREKLSHILNRPGESIPIIPVSSKTKLAYLKSQDPEDLEDSNFAALESQLWQLLNQQRGYILIMRGLRDLGRTVAEMKTPLQAEWDACLQSPAASADMECQFQAAKQRLQNLLDNNSAWRTQLIDGLQDVRTEILERFKQGMIQIRRQAEKYLDDGKLLASPEQIASLLEVEIDALMSNLGTQLGELSATLHGQIEASTRLNINPFEIGSLPQEKVKFLVEEGKIKLSGWWEKTLSVARNGGFTGTVGATIGGIVGGTVGGAIGALFGGVGAVPGATIGQQIGAALGGLAGIKTGATQALSEDKEKNKRQVSKVINRFIEDSQELCHQSLNDVIKDLERSMRDELTDQIKREKETCDRTLHSIQETRKLSKEQTERKVAELKAPLQQLTQLQKGVEQLAQTLVAQSEAAPPPTQSSPTTDNSQQPATDKGDWADE